MKKRIINIMKLSGLLLMLTILQVWAVDSYSQHTKLTLNLKNVTVEDALKTIEDQSEFFFLYSPKMVDVSRKVDIELANKKVDFILNQMFAGTGVDYVIKDRQIVVTTDEMIQPFKKETPQQIVVTGKVTDEDGNSLPGVNITIKGTVTGTISNADGNYNIEVDDPDATLVFSFVGMRTQEVVVENQTTINITLQVDAIGLDEIVAIGYGSQRKATLTGSVVNVKGEILEAAPTTSITNSMTGRLPGVVALNRTGEPGSDVSSILIRGKSTLGNNDVLVVIDGVAGRETLDQIDPRDIESISVLKDASAAIYGARAANGVILITTKRGKSGKPSINFTYNYGIYKPTFISEHANSEEIATFQNLRAADLNDPLPWDADEIRKLGDGSDPTRYPNTVWTDEVFKDYSTQSKAGLSIRGGSEAVKYFVSSNLSEVGSIYIDGINGSKKVGVLSNVDIAVSDNLDVSLDLSFNNQNATYNSDNADPPNILLQTYGNFPYLLAMNPDGSYGEANPVLKAGIEAGYRKEQRGYISTKTAFKLRIPQVKGLSVDGFIAYDKRNIISKHWTESYLHLQSGYDPFTDTYFAPGGDDNAPTLTEGSSSRTALTTNLKLNYEKIFGDHRINTFVAFEQSETKFKDFSAYRENFITTEVEQIFAGSSENQRTTGSEQEFTRRNYFGRIGYGFKDKYLVDVTLRYDGSSIFPEGSRYGFFPGVSVGWRLSEEQFIQNIDIVDNLKLRASWGQMGNDQVDPFQYLANYRFGDSEEEEGYIVGDPAYLGSTLYQGVEPNPNITWEVATTVNFGIDASLWNGGLGVAFDVFKSTRTDILTMRSTTIPDFTGLNLPNENIGEVVSNGFELELSHRKSFGDFSYFVSANISHAKNEVVFIDEVPLDERPWQEKTGHAVGADLYYISDGIYRTQAEIDNSPHVAGTRVGDLKYKDLNGDGNIDNDDMKRLDQTNIPQTVYGVSLGMEYKQFYMSALFQGQSNVSQYYYIRQQVTGINMLHDLLDNPLSNPTNSAYPNITDDPGEVSGLQSDFWLKDVSFVRLKTLEFGYNLSTGNNFLSKIGIDSGRIYVNGFNLLTFSDFDWFDPEGTTGRGAFYPQNKIFNLGINLTF